jgi:hypothetical protein
VALAGEDDVDGSPCWHLNVRPLESPGRHRIRELWIDEATFQTRRVVSMGNFQDRATSGQLWTTTYTEVNGSWYIESEASQSVVHAEIGSFDRVLIQFLDVADDTQDNLNFGLSGDIDNVLTEPAEAL